MVDFDEGTENLVGKYAQELYETGRFSHVNIKALGVDGYDYLAVVQDDNNPPPASAEAEIPK